MYRRVVWGVGVMIADPCSMILCVFLVACYVDKRLLERLVCVPMAWWSEGLCVFRWLGGRTNQWCMVSKTEVSVTISLLNLRFRNVMVSQAKVLGTI
jgi:hypothetical protein